ncbi:MAG: hypothetical protein MUO63_14535 [Desulfobulbaceae bacterium]|nr:hypothetical protein [Desulfobulbaceae bacterium]
MTAIAIGPVPTAQEGNTVNRQIEEQNQLVDFEETPEAPEPPDIGIAVRVWPTQVEPGKPVFMAGSYSADGALLNQCQQNLAACVVLTLVRIEGDKLFKTSLPLITLTVERKPPPPRDYGPYYRVEEQFKLDLITFFDLPKKRAAYSIEVALGSYSSGQHTFRVGKP